MTNTIQEEHTRYQEKMHKCDGCGGKAKTRIRVWNTWPTFLDLCNHHTNRVLAMYDDAEILEDNRGDDDYKVH